MGSWTSWTAALLLGCVGRGDPAGTPAEDPVPTNPDGVGGGEEGDGPDLTRADFLFGDEITELALEVDAEAVAILQAQTAEAATEDVHATLIYGEERYDVGLHVGGGLSTWSPWDVKPVLKVDVHQWDPEQKFHGTRRFTLENQLLDATRIAERTADHLLVALDVPGARHGFARLTVNGADYGLYQVEEALDEQFIDLFWEDDEGPLYEADGDLLAGELGSFSYAERPEVDTDDAELHALVSDLATSTADTMLEVLDRRFDLDRLFALWSVELVTGNARGYTTQARSYGLYWEPAADTWTMFPWDEELAFTAELDVTGLYVGYAYQLCMGSPDCRAALAVRIEDTVDAWEAVDLPARAAAEAELVAEACAADTRHPAGAAGCEAARRAMEAFVAGRASEARAQLGP